MPYEIAQPGGYRFETARHDLALAPADLARLLDVWREQAGAGWLPHPSSATFDAFVFMIGRVHLVELGADGTFRYRLYGTGSHYPIDAHKATTARIRPAAFRALVEASYVECAAERAPVYRDIRLVGPRRSARMHRLLLPYACDGRTPDLIVTGFVEEPGLADIFRDPEFHATRDDLVLEDPD
jgi:hypothetical protein